MDETDVPEITLPAPADPAPLYLGLDVGSTATKAVVLDGGGRVRARALVPSGTDFFAAARDATDRAIARAGGIHVVRTVATGYGRRNVPFAREAVTEITCHARGALHHGPGPFTLVDIGGQDNKIVRGGADGRVTDFTMNRKCAAGTGAFLEEMARRLDLELSALEPAARSASGEATIGSFCTVFASTEILKRIREGAPVPALARGALRSVVRRVVEMGRLAGAVRVSGGVAAHHPLVVAMLAEETGAEVTALPDAQYVGALGAALVARDAGERAP